ncbi:MAG: hypothetical protein U9N10_09290 [Bacillota bacterium]|nr:hypothetical protein [Bacillota bacterium]
MNINLIYILTAVIIGMVMPGLFQIFKDLKVGEGERKLLMEIVTETISNLIKLAAIETNEDLILVATDITISKLKDNNIKTFTRSEIQQIIKIIIDKLPDEKSN